VQALQFSIQEVQTPLVTKDPTLQDVQLDIVDPMQVRQFS
jgi:hypothetical protein